MLQELGHAVGLVGPVHKRYKDRAFMDRPKDTMKVADADVSRYDAIYMTGGHDVCFDFRSADLAKLDEARNVLRRHSGFDRSAWAAVRADRANSFAEGSFRTEDGQVIQLKKEHLKTEKETVNKGEVKVRK
ncbi:ThiJ/PfpI OS=Nitrosospira multiformis (strain ATCC 25196 / NCIMB 11849) GN=Nmul_A1134 PE=4 SV=1 [Gemmata massiliana]|uniref:ThiJ/PfpI n=1 Tax=Gemmata massiliana TaxID=1210884 RepID=A0A6P2D436_9BACT|nr:hypothetical protein [Gemmata massiliana]VTR94160.1 ThiJ/PfpI OS=Nitrosospira multiformis (strain ATCC 25196 / NCIMB 11849) GN=Nmul_A1134 PE=4 SV=1 [Gemmata massiliana]